MARFVPDSKTLRWVIISPHRALRPGEDIKRKREWRKKCPFCPGSPVLKTDEVFRLAAGGELWKVMVIKNRYPITDIAEVIILSPDCKKDFDRLSIEHVEYVLQTYRQRYQLHSKTGQVFIFHNFGEPAGASVEHPHSQLVVIPNQVSIKPLSVEPVFNVVSESESFIVYCPEFSQWPYEVWIAPRGWGVTFGEITDKEIKELATVLKRTIVSLKKTFPNLSYNFYIYPGRSWYLRIIPRLIDRGGVELGTGIQVNIVDPKQAAAEIRAVFEKIKV
jgi:UDPglucose--hexose-1-phosphate uridylyltransferase